ncbi:LacI family DNA-binding transcriptional regulator [Pseudoxanthomonas sp.]|uniref:LacI family DNA-binding transcriptional regulator n=1 Tax=Pseudoxanthomonas sp. TaxID=1871049 RepID=UPI00262C23DF|nr:LacI family DNA-binding transcriptional regulator [Pseudoxanthomonas sp.]WDS35036.1 MAG: LacI family DNA-binding transcriptional regulator [Pseudoxanthomonas sp.]
MPPRLPPGRPATASDVAELAEVSQSAVSRTFTPGASVSEITRARVLAAAAKLNYTPNHLARSLSTQRSQIVGVALTYLDNQFYPQVLQRLSDELGKAGYRVLLFITHGRSEADPALEELLRYRVDALILASTSLSSRLAAECARVGVPVVMFNTVDADSTTPGVSGSNVLGGRTIASYLATGGHQRFAFLAGASESSTTRERERGFVERLAELGHPRPRREEGYYTFDGALAATRRLLKPAQRPDAIFCANDHMAMAALQVARIEFGLEPGRDVSIVGFDDVDIARWPGFSLTTYSQPAASMVTETIRILRQLLAGKPPAQQRTQVPGRLIVRGSARQPATGVRQDEDGIAFWEDVSATA